MLLSWSSGKDRAWALHVLRQQRDVEVTGLLATLNEAADRGAMHAVGGNSWKRKQRQRAYVFGRSSYRGSGRLGGKASGEACPEIWCIALCPNCH